ncbi:ABC transporter substrate-binding protein [Nostoc sphaeroides CHAB 2801]|uniref:caspase, EACC1-associated type n=1 Tax=Nostoc sphaeroides TaxID=446679 RepID=UPI000E46D03F|nr:ABC transporter substrate-binding protein [Nostoc sphaeroides]MCC5629766.1 ABC transporter substrate-binding protein [Nostoc sphaeroides CHAB 2801]
MAKIALLIGVSEYDSGLDPLPATIKDVEAMQQVLEDPEIGDFNEVKILINPQQHEMGVAIQTLFDNRQRDDLLLLFFSGHGIKDESGKLHFAARNTHKNPQGKLFESTAVPASFVHKFMSDSRSRREVVILDCCFSGAFAEDMAAKDDGFVDVKNQLGGEGRAVLTSSTSTQFSFVQLGAETSTYTRYIVEGLETGAADRDEDGLISVDELHEYAAKKVQGSTPAMKPEIYAIKEGYKIKLAKAPIDEPKLKYGKDVEYWVRDGEISDIGRIALDRQQKILGLTPDEAAAKEAEVLKPYQDYKENLHKYEEALRKEIKHKFPSSDKTRADLKRLQQALGLRDEDIALIEAPIIAEQPLTTPLVVTNDDSDPQNSNVKYYIVACIIGVIGVFVGGTLVYFLLQKNLSPPNPTCAKKTYSLNDRISLGEEVLLRQDTNPAKEAGVKAFLEGECQTAIEKLNLYRKANLSDPEALIYLNNAKARQKEDKLKIAVSVPIGTNPNVAKEILRGVAQAQDEVNSSGGINGKALEVAIANDDNDPSEAVQLATRFGRDASILAVVGHNASNASLSAAPVYQRDGLVMITPTSYAPNLSNVGNYIFRTAPSVSSIADKVSDYAINTAGKTNFLFCVDPQSLDNLLFKDKFVKAIKAANGNINPTDCNISTSNFNSNAVISEAIRSGANGLVLAIYIERIKQGLAIAQANQGQLNIFGSPTLLTNEVLKEGKAINGIIIPVPWHPIAFSNHSFPKKAQTLWGGPVNWRTATTYDATTAIAKGLQQSNTREGLQKALHSPSFSIDGATGNIQFSQSGDRTNNSIFLVKVQQIPGTDKYEFVPIQP